MADTPHNSRASTSPRHGADGLRFGPGERRRQLLEEQQAEQQQAEQGRAEQLEEPTDAPSSADSMVAFRLRHTAVPFSNGASVPSSDLHHAIETIVGDLSATATMSWIGPDDLFGIAAVQDKPEAEALVRFLFDATSVPLMVNGTMVSLTPRIGAVFNESQALDGAGSIVAATIALRSTSDEIPSRMHSPQLAEEAARRTNLESELRQAIDRSGVESTSEVALDIGSNSASDAFLLPRWSSAVEGAVAPNTLIELSRDVSRSKHVAIQMLAHGLQIGELTERPLWLPIDGSDVIDDAFVDHLLMMTADCEHRMGIVLSQGPGLHLPATIRALKRLRDRQIGIAIDGIGARGAVGVFDLANLGADLLIVEAETIRMASYRTTARRALMTLAALVHSYEMRVCGRGIDTDSLLEISTEAGLDLAVGTAVSASAKLAHA